MAIVKMTKFTLLAFESQKKELLEKFQGYQNVEFINLQDEDFLENNEDFAKLSKDNVTSDFTKYEERLSQARFSLEFLEKYVPKKGMIASLKKGKREYTLAELEKEVLSSNWENSYKELKDSEIKLSELSNEKTKYESEIALLSKWGNFDADFKTVKGFKRTTSLLGTVSSKFEEELSSELRKFDNVYLEVINKDAQDAYLFILIHEDDKKAIDEITKKYGFSIFTTSYEESPRNLITDFGKRVEDISYEEELVISDLNSKVEDYESFKLAYEYYQNLVNRENVQSNFLKTDSIVSMVGWVPEEEKSKVEALAGEILGQDYYLNFEDVKDEEINDVPIKLKNNKLVSVFENITEMYSLPKYNEVDPTPLLAPFYLVFFGMMLADMGYGLALSLGAFLILKMFKFEEGMKKTISFFGLLGIPTIIFGCIYGSFLGMTVITPIIDVSNDINTVLILSIAFGVIQIFMGLGIKNYIIIRDGGTLMDVFTDAGAWMVNLTGIGIMVGGIFGSIPVVKNIGMIIMIIGFILIFLSGAKNADTTGGKIGSGLYEVYGISGYIGDLVSYTRLMALGLSGGSMAAAYNLIVGMFPKVAIPVAILLFIVLHLFNLFLGALGAYVHTCRLQYVEYFGKYYDGGGRAFKPFKTVEKYINLKNK